MSDCQKKQSLKNPKIIIKKNSKNLKKRKKEEKTEIEGKSFVLKENEKKKIKSDKLYFKNKKNN